MLLKIFVKNGVVKFASYPILYYYIVMASTAPLWFSLRDWLGFKKLLAAVITYFIIKAIK